MYQGEVLQRQGWWCKRFPDKIAAELFVVGRIEADSGTVNPVRDFRVTEVPPRSVIRWGTGRQEDVSCPVCKLPVAAFIGIHFDCSQQD